MSETKGAFNGVISDFKRRSSFWVNDFTSGINLKVIASILFMFQIIILGRINE